MTSMTFFCVWEKIQDDAIRWRGLPKDWGWGTTAHEQSTLLLGQYEKACFSLGVCGWNFFLEKVWENCPPNKDLVQISAVKALIHFWNSSY